MGNTLVYNPHDGSKISKFAWDDGEWESLEVNDMKAYPDHVAEEMLKRYGFLEKVSPEDVLEVKQKMGQKPMKCEYCSYVAYTEKQMTGHLMGKHKVSDEAKKVMGEIKVAHKTGVSPTGKVVQTPEGAEGIPDTSDLGSGEFRQDWYGKGLEADMPSSMGVSRPGMTGHFGG